MRTVARMELPSTSAATICARFSALNAARQRIADLDREGGELAETFRSLKEQLDAPKLIPKIMNCRATEVKRDEHSPLAGLASIALGLGPSTDVILSVYLTISNIHRVETKVCGWGIDFNDYTRSFSLQPVDPRLLMPIKYGLPIDGWVAFRLDYMGVQTTVNCQFSIVITDGTGVSYRSDPWLISRVEPLTKEVEQ